MKTERVGIGKKSFDVKKGALHSMLHIPQDETIPQSDLKPKSGDYPLLRRRKASAKVLEHMHGRG